MILRRCANSLLTAIHTASIRLRLTLLVMATTVLVLVFASSFISSRATLLIEHNSDQQLASANHTLATTVSVWLESPLNAMQNLVAQPDIISMHPDRQKPLLKIMASAYPYMYLISTTDLRGINIARSDLAAPKNYSDRNWFKRAADGEPVVFESLIARTISVPAMVVSVPIRGSGKQIIGVGMFATDLKHLSQRVHVSQVGKTGLAYVVDRENRVIAHPDQSFTNELRDLSTYPPVKALRQGKSGLIAFKDEQGKQWKAHISALDNGWGIIVQQQDMELMATRQLFRQISFSATLLAGLVLLCSTWLVVRRALRPVQQLSDAVAEVTTQASGLTDLEPVLLATRTIRSRDEVGVLAASFNAMAARLQETMQSLSQELSEHRLTALSLKNSEERYRSLVDNLNIGVYQNTLDPKGRFLQANPAMLKIFGYDSLDEFLSIHVSDIYLDPDDRHAFLEEVAMSGSVHDKELKLRRKDGTPIWASVSATVGCEENSGNCLLYGVIEDTTERKKLEDQLRQSQKMEAIGTFAGGIAHDFNNILTAIIGYTTLLKMRLADNEKLLGYTNDILSSSDKATNLTQSLLAFSRKKIISPVPQDLNAIVRRVDKFLHRIIGEDIELKTAFADEPLTVLADSSQLEQVLMNLATNGRDAMPNGGVLTISTAMIEIPKTHNFMEPGKYAVITCSDTGQGMDEATRRRIFEPFYTTKEAGKGTGLGLSIVYGIIQQHSGEINVYSEPGKGTTFRIYLKHVSEAAEDAGSEQPQAVVGGTETILLAEDNQEVRGLMRSILEEFGYTVIEAADGEEAIEQYLSNKDRIHLLILDVVMPKKNGKEVYDQIRALDATMPTLFASGYTADIIHQKGILEEGMNFISKPVTPPLLLKKVRDVIDCQS
ncbi:MAG TPA: ATP-binding protein [Deltaproteobacteria bacterium]|nr:ATP-binding protein [Deltaproteobacteria bacterium]HQB38295.1 ATP-binding protein [Deltaproteobacteria bacterium]